MTLSVITLIIHSSDTVPTFKIKHQYIVMLHFVKGASMSKKFSIFFKKHVVL